MKVLCNEHEQGGNICASSEPEVFTAHMQVEFAIVTISIDIAIDFVFCTMGLWQSQGNEC